MKLPLQPLQVGILAGLICLGAPLGVFMLSSPTPVLAQTTAAVPRGLRTTRPSAADTNAPSTNTVAAAAPVAAVQPPGEPAATPPPNVPGGAIPGAPQPPAGNPPPAGGPPAGGPPGASPTDDTLLSFQGANIEMVVQWLAKATGKSVVKHPKVQCQLTIVSSKKLLPREAINLVYRALALEGFSVVESSNSILIVPEGQEPKVSPEIMQADKTEMPEGRQRYLKIFTLKNAQATDLKDKVKGVVSDKGTVEVAERSNQLMVTDYTDNVRILTELIKELDVPATGDATIEFFELKHSEAEELGNLISMVINSQPAPPPSPSSSSSPSSRSSRSSSMEFPPGIVMPTPSSSSSSSSSSASAAAGAGQVRIWPDKVSNRLIVSAPKSKIPEVKRLIDLLDTEKPQDFTLRVLPLKNVNASDLVREIGPMYQKMSGKALKENIEVTFNERSNSLIILSSESNFRSIEKLIGSLDTEDASEKAMQAFPLKNAEAEDVAKQIQDLNQDQNSGSRYPFYIFSYGGSSGRDTKKINVVADRRRNTVIVQAPPSAMENLAKMIRTLDEPVSDNALTPKIFRLKYVSATDIEEVLNELFLKKQNQRAYWDPYGFPSSGGDNDKAGGRLYGKVRITSEPYSNSLIVTANSPESLSALEDVLKELDQPSQAGETTMRVGLKFAKAMTVATSLNILFAKGGSPPLRAVPQPGQPNEVRQGQAGQFAAPENGFSVEQETKEEGYFPWLGGQPETFRTTDGRNAQRPVSDLVGRVRVVPDRRVNSLLVTCNVHFFPQVLKLINELDAPTAQVLIEARIIEVSSDFRDKLGVRWSPDGDRTFDASDLDGSVKVSAGSTMKKVFAGPALPIGGNSAAAAAVTGLKSGVLESTVNLDVLIQFLRKNTDSTVLAEPQINVADNELGKLFVGAQVPFITGSVNNTLGGRNDTFDYKPVGIILEVTPHINDSQEVALRIHAESSSIRPGETLLGGAILDTRNFRTDVQVKSGETIVIGGIIQRDSVNTIRKVPGLGSIPGLGWAFKKKDKGNREVELMVFLRPWVTRTPEDAKNLLKEIEKKTPLIQKSDAEGTSEPNVDVEKAKKRKEETKH